MLSNTQIENAMTQRLGGEQKRDQNPFFRQQKHKRRGSSAGSSRPPARQRREERGVE